jgi:phosphotransferase system IIA component
MVCLLTMTKPSNVIHPITMGEALYQLTSHILCFQFSDAFATHFSPHQFGITTKGGCEIMIHGIMCTLDFHPN